MSSQFKFFKGQRSLSTNKRHIFLTRIVSKTVFPFLSWRNSAINEHCLSSESISLSLSQSSLSCWLSFLQSGSFRSFTTEARVGWNQPGLSGFLLRWHPQLHSNLFLFFQKCFQTKKSLECEKATRENMNFFDGG